MRTFTGIAVSPGVAVGRLCVIDRRRVAVNEYAISDEAVSFEISRLHAAVVATRNDLESLKSRLVTSTGEDHLFFIETHLLILADERLVSETVAIIENSLINAESALLDLLSPVYAIKPRSTEFALARGKKLVSALTRINAYVSSLYPPRPLITSGGKGLEQLTAASSVLRFVA